MKKLLIIICIFTGLYFFPASVSADSPVTSTSFSVAYEDIEIVKEASDKGIINSEIARYLYDSKNPIDVKAAVINALSWGEDNKENTQQYCLLSYKKTLDQISVKDLRGDQLFCIGYLLAMDNYNDTAPALKYLRLAEQKITDSFTISVVTALVESMQPEGNIWEYVRPILEDSSITMDMKPDAVNIIVDYMASYSEKNQLEVSNNNVMIKSEKNQKVYLYGSFTVKDQCPYQITRSSNIAYTTLNRDQYGIYYVMITGVKNGFSTIKITNDENKSVTIHFSVVSKNTYSKLGNTLAMYIGNVNSYLGKTKAVMSKDEKPFIKNNKQMIPVKFTCQAIGGKYKYDSKKRTYKITYGQKTIVLKAGSKSAAVNGEINTLTTKIEIKNNILFIALKDFTKLFNKKYIYDNGLIFVTDNAMQISTTTDDFILDEIANLVTQGKLTMHEPTIYVEAGLYGYEDYRGKKIIAPTFHQADNFNEGLAAVSIIDKQGIENYGFIDINGKFVIDPIYPKVKSFAGGLAPVLNKEDSKWGYIDQHGTLVIPYRYADCTTFQEGIAAVKIDNKWGYIDRNGTILIQASYDEAEAFYNGLATVKSNSLEYNINLSGMTVIYKSSGDFYVGETKDGLYHGNGVYTWANGTQYYGEFSEGKFTGKASFTTTSGIVIQGYWKEGSYLGDSPE